MSKSTHYTVGRRVKAVIGMLEKGLSRGEIFSTCVSKWGVSTRTVDEYMARARDAIGDPIPKKKKREAKEGYVYLIASDIGPYKIGLSANPTNRLKAFAHMPFSASLVCVIKSDDMRALESSLHARFKTKHLRGEWFNLAAEDVEYIKSLSMHHHG